MADCGACVRNKLPGLEWDSCTRVHDWGASGGPGGGSGVRPCRGPGRQLRVRKRTRAIPDRVGHTGLGRPPGFRPETCSESAARPRGLGWDSTSAGGDCTFSSSKTVGNRARNRHRPPGHGEAQRAGLLTEPPCARTRVCTVPSRFLLHRWSRFLPCSSGTLRPACPHHPLATATPSVRE